MFSWSQRAFILWKRTAQQFLFCVQKENESGFKGGYGKPLSLMEGKSNPQ